MAGRHSEHDRRRSADPFPFPGREDEALKYRQSTGRARPPSGTPPRCKQPQQRRGDVELTSPETGKPLSFAANSTKGMPHDEEDRRGHRSRSTARSPLIALQATAYHVRCCDAVDSQGPGRLRGDPDRPEHGPERGQHPPPTPRPFVEPAERAVAFDHRGAGRSLGRHVYRGAGRARNALKSRSRSLLAPDVPDARSSPPTRARSTLWRSRATCRSTGSTRGRRTRPTSRVDRRPATCSTEFDGLPRAEGQDPPRASSP